MYFYEYLQTRSNYWTMNFQLQFIQKHPYVYIYYITLHIMYTLTNNYVSASYNLLPYVVVHCSNYTSWHKNNCYVLPSVLCSLYIQVPHLSSGKLAHLVLSAKNAMARGMTALIAIFLWCMVLGDRVFIVGLLAFLLEVVNVEKRKAGFKPG